ncbi:DUF349 domain-containing protein [uncultured Microbacterium sp.]|uniref:DUF349 domain-containing protein n=1 Tax=uncultured Microbacterium sp. TaxID=191216 RepID=UPI00261136F0|nr:DUF349 domain-containing protein [uncultured Microbacterium sp.]
MTNVPTPESAETEPVVEDLPDASSADVVEEIPTPADTDASADAAVETPADADAAAETPVEVDTAVETPADADDTTAAPADADTSAEPPAPATPKPRAVPGKPKSAIRPIAPAAPTVSAASAADALAAASFGRVEIDGTVSVRDGDGWREVGQYPDGTPEEALAYFVRKFLDLAGEVTLLEARNRRDGASASELRTTLQTVRERVSGASAVGDFAALETRLTRLDAALSKASAEQSKAQRAAVDAAIAERTVYVERIEALAARDPKSIQWKQTSAEVTDLFEQWQKHQATGPRLPKTVGQQLWKRFRDARATLDKHRREFYSGLDEQHKSARDSKAKLAERAEALVSKGEDGIADYRALLDQWKNSGRAGKKADDALWARFKAAGDALYAARAGREEADAEASKEKIEAKRALLIEAAAVPKEKDTAKARQLLTSIQRRWDEIGRVFPREAERGLDDDLRKIEQGLKQREETDWKSNNPETKARQNDMTQQLRDAIAGLEADLEAAKAKKDKGAITRATEALDARKAWLKALGG